MNKEKTYYVESPFELVLIIYFSRQSVYTDRITFVNFFYMKTIICKFSVVYNWFMSLSLSVFLFVHRVYYCRRLT